MRAAVVAVDGGGSKIDAAAITREGSVLGAARIRQGQDGRDPTGPAAVGMALELVCHSMGMEAPRAPLAPVGIYCLAGADLPADERRFERELGRLGWSEEIVLRNDTYAVLRAGTERTWGVGVVCGFGTNCTAISPKGRTFRLPALGWIAGDWGGGSDIGEAALWHAIRARDGRGPRTMLASRVPEHFGLRRPKQVMEALHHRRLDPKRMAELPPLVFAGAAEGDVVARSIVDRQADEIVTMASAAIRRLGMSDLDVHVVLGGGIFRNPFPPFHRRIDEGIRLIAPAAEILPLTAPPIVGSALIGLDRIGASPTAKSRVREALTHDLLAHRLDAAQEG